MIVNKEENSLTIQSLGNTVSGDSMDAFEISLPVTVETPHTDTLEIVINRLFMTSLLKSVYTDNCSLIIQSATEPLFLENENNDNATYLMLPINKKSR